MRSSVAATPGRATGQVDSQNRDAGCTESCARSHVLWRLDALLRGLDWRVSVPDALEFGVSVSDLRQVAALPAARPL